ncbi:MAG: beta-ketoacyl synthase chain length factor [Chitinophagaceae bacterium]
MKTFIRATGNISPQKTAGAAISGALLLPELVTQTGNRLHCTEPDYLSYIDTKFIRRMSRIIKMGTAAAMDCLREAELKNPDAIVMGTAYGCLDDTGIFLKKMVEQKEEMLTPTAFIQSTHNTIGAQIALMLQCHNYNNTFVHRGFSFESALLDAMMLLEEDAATTVLTGAADEITDYSHAILSRFGLYKKAPISNADLFTTQSKGTIAGEGAAFFLLSSESSPKNYAVLDALHTFYKPAGLKETEEQVTGFLAGQSIAAADIDLVITGCNGDTAGDTVYHALGRSLFSNNITINYKQLCGEYPTSTAFALWLAASIIKQGSLPPVFDLPNAGEIKRILIYNHYENIHHSLMLVSAC